MRIKKLTKIKESIAAINVDMNTKSKKNQSQIINVKNAVNGFLQHIS